MARIAGVDVPRDKRIEIALTYIYGIGLTTSKRLLQLAAISPDTRTTRPSKKFAAPRKLAMKRDTGR